MESANVENQKNTFGLFIKKGSYDHNRQRLTFGVSVKDGQLNV
jgi:hypothetical protein